MAHQLSSPPLIKGIDGIVSRSPNEVNYSILNGKRMQTGKPPENKIQRKYKKYGISGNMAKYVKQEENAGKNGNLMKPGKENETELIKTDVESVGEDVGTTREKNDRNGKIRSQILITPPITVYTAAQVPLETTMTIKITTMITTMERRK